MIGRSSKSSVTAPRRAAVRKAFCPSPHAPEHRRIGQHGNAPGPAWTAQDATHHQQPRPEGCRLKSEEGHHVGQQRQRRAPQQVDRRVEKELIGNAWHGCGDLGGGVGDPIVRQRRCAGDRKLARGVEADEVGRLGWDRAEHVMMPEHQKAQEQHLEGEQQTAAGDDAIAA